jgi:aryl-alcohol dehydrogenase-like predicted oxidoreductase
MSPESSRSVPRVALAPGYEVARVINGGWQLSAGHRPRPADADAVVDDLLRLVDAGFDTFDCGDIYTGVEALLGRVVAVHARRGSTAPIRIHTKFVPDLDDLPRIDRRYVERIVDRSMTRLGVERLDLVQLMWWDYTVPRYVETAAWLDELRRAGKIRLLGATNFDVERLEEIVFAGIPMASHQVQYSLLDRRPERGMADVCERHGIKLLCYGSLAGGFLSERWLRQPTPEPPLSNRSLVKYRLIIDELGGWERYQELLAALEQIALRHAVSVANVAVRWVLDRPEVAAAIVGAADARHGEDNGRVFTFSLDDEDRERLRPFDGVGPAGAVYTAERQPDGPHAAIMRYNLNRES